VKARSPPPGLAPVDSHRRGGTAVANAMPTATARVVSFQESRSVPRSLLTAPTRVTTRAVAQLRHRRPTWS
jgi:hypothetical protein